MQEIPPDDAGGYDLRIEEISAEGESYQATQQQLRDRVPSGWRVIGWLVDRDPS